MEFTPQNVVISRVSPDDAATLAARYLMEELQNPRPNEPFTTICDTHHAALRSLEEVFNIIPKYAEQESTNIHNGPRLERQEVAAKLEQVSAPVTYCYPERQHKH